MFCANCGEKVTEGSVFCPSCGAKINTKSKAQDSDVKTMKLRCKNCNGIMESDADNQQIVCPFCGSKELILDSDTVAVEKIRSNTYKEVEYEKMKHENEREQRRESKEERDNYRKSKLSKATIVFTVICLLSMFAAFGSKHILAGIIALIQVGLFATSWLMGMQIIKEKKKSLYVALAVLAFIMIIPFFMANSIKKSEKLDWPTIGIATNIPKPSTKYGNVNSNSEDSFFASLDKVSQKEYNEYIEKCKGMGYIVESNSDTYGYEAFNEDGYKLDVSYYSSNESMQISLDAPMEAKEFKWPRSEIAQLIPQPKSNIGKVEWEHDYGFAIYVADTSQEEFTAYAEECADAGFVVDYSKGDTYYYADNEEGYHLNLKHEGNNTMFVRMDEPVIEENTTGTEEEAKVGEVTTEEASEEECSVPEEAVNEKVITSEAASENKVTEELVDGMRPAFKEAMDAYEAFYKEYCDLLKKYNENPTDITLLAEYTEMLDKTVEMDKKFAEWDEEDLNDAELVYYAEVNIRVVQMMNDVY